MRATPGLCWSDSIPPYVSVPVTVALPDPAPQPEPQPDDRLRGALPETSGLVPLRRGEELIDAMRRGAGVRNESSVRKLEAFAQRINAGGTTASAAMGVGVGVRTAMRYRNRLAAGEPPHPTRIELAAWSIKGSGTTRTLKMRRAANLDGVVVCALWLTGGRPTDPIPVEYTGGYGHFEIDVRPVWVDANGNQYIARQCGLAGQHPELAQPYLEETDPSWRSRSK